MLDCPNIFHIEQSYVQASNLLLKLASATQNFDWPNKANFTKDLGILEMKVIVHWDALETAS
jgi:hypothetical protein